MMSSPCWNITLKLSPSFSSRLPRVCICYDLKFPHPPYPILGFCPTGILVSAEPSYGLLLTHEVPPAFSLSKMATRLLLSLCMPHNSVKIFFNNLALLLSWNISDNSQTDVGHFFLWTHLGFYPENYYFLIHLAFISWIIIGLGK